MVGSPRAFDRRPTVRIWRAMAEIVEEFFRQQAIFPAAVVARRDWLLGVVGVDTTQQPAYRLFVETNQPLHIGIKQWSAPG